MLQVVAATQDPIEALSQNKLEKSDLSSTERGFLVTCSLSFCSTFHLVPSMILIMNCMEDDVGVECNVTAAYLCLHDL